MNGRPQVSLKETIAAQRSLESELASSRSADSNRDFRTKELEGRMRALEKENEMLRQKVRWLRSDARTSKNLSGRLWSREMFIYINREG